MRLAEKFVFLSNFLDDRTDSSTACRTPNILGANIAIRLEAASTAAYFALAFNIKNVRKIQNWNRDFGCGLAARLLSTRRLGDGEDFRRQVSLRVLASEPRLGLVWTYSTLSTERCSAFWTVENSRMLSRFARGVIS